MPGRSVHGPIEVETGMAGAAREIAFPITARFAAVPGACGHASAPRGASSGVGRRQRPREEILPP